MQNEIGGYIEFEHYSEKQFHENAVKLNCARNCLAYLIQSYKIEKVYLPYFLCDSVWKTCKKYGVEFEFYHIDENFMPIVPNADFEKDWLYAVNYYGELTNEKIMSLSKHAPNLIIDNVQAFFQLPVSHIPTLYSCRKFFGVADGAYLYTDSKLSEKFERDISYNRMDFLLGRFEKSAQEFYPQYAANNDLFENEPVKLMSGLTENLMRSFDYERIAKRRTENFKYLHERLQKLNELKPQIPYGAFAYPLLVKNGSEIRKKLQCRKIYIPTLWADTFDVCEEKDIENYYAKNILPIPGDQRYEEREMKILVEEISRLIL